MAIEVPDVVAVCVDGLKACASQKVKSAATHSPPESLLTLDPTVLLLDVSCSMRAGWCISLLVSVSDEEMTIK